MADDLADILALIESCRNEIKLLSTEIDEYIRESVEFRYDTHAPNFSISAILLKKVPVNIRARAGKTIRELRSCLDGLALRLAIRNGCTNTTGVGFPISESRITFDTDGRKKIKKLSSSDQEKIMAFQPFQFRNRKLWALHEIDRRPMHVRLEACAFFSTVEPSRPSPSDSMMCSEFPMMHLKRVGKEIVIVRGAPVTMPHECRVEITYAKPQIVWGNSVIQLLASWVDDVNFIVHEFLC